MPWVDSIEREDFLIMRVPTNLVIVQNSLIIHLIQTKRLSLEYRARTGTSFEIIIVQMRSAIALGSRQEAGQHLWR